MKESQKEASRWFLQAENDFQFVEWVHKERIFFDKGCFIAQQAGEKALKACLFAQGERRVIGHSLFELANRLYHADSSFKSINDEVKRLDRFYIPTRYPNGLPGGSPFQVYTENDLLDAYDDLKKIIEISRKFLEERKVLSLK